MSQFLEFSNKNVHSRERFEQSCTCSCLVITVCYCSLLGGYWWLLLVPTFSMNDYWHSTNFKLAAGDWIPSATNIVNRLLDMNKYKKNVPLLHVYILIFLLRLIFCSLRNKLNELHRSNHFLKTKYIFCKT